MFSYERNSFEGKEADLMAIISEFPDGDEMPGQMIPVRKLSKAFDNFVENEETCAKTVGNMKVYLRVRPMQSKSSSESTITVESGMAVANFIRSFIFTCKKGLKMIVILITIFRSHDRNERTGVF